MMSIWWVVQKVYSDHEKSWHDQLRIKLNLRVRTYRGQCIIYRIISNTEAIVD